MDCNVSDDEPIARYLVRGKHYSPLKSEIKANAFRPPYKSPELSVYRIQELREPDVWEIADKFVAPALKGFDGSLDARADLLSVSVRKQRLDVVPDTTPHQRHANIVGWRNAPSDLEDEEQKKEARELWNSIAGELILDATLVIRE